MFAPSLTFRPTIPLITIPGRTFQMGSAVGGYADEHPIRSVTLSPYRISDLVSNAHFEMYEKAHPDSLFGILWHQPNGEVSVIARGVMENKIAVTGKRASRRKQRINENGKAIPYLVGALLEEYEKNPHQIAPPHLHLAETAAMSVFQDWCETTGVGLEGTMAVLIQGLQELGVRFEVRQLVPKKGERVLEERLAGPKQPAVEMKWYWAKGFAAWMGMRLATEAEYENAARGVSGEEEYGLSLDRAHWNQDRDTGATVAVGGPERRNGYGTGEEAQKGGFQDGSGNANTWCEDNYGPYDPKDLINPRGPEESETKCLRGGSWLNDLADHLRAAFRYYYDPDYRYHRIGFRVAAAALQDS